MLYLNVLSKNWEDNTDIYFWKIQRSFGTLGETNRMHVKSKKTRFKEHKTHVPL